MNEKMMRDLSEAYGVSGFETEIKDVIRRYADNHYDELREDSLGNLIFKIGEGDKKILIESHMDEVGLIVKYIDDNGFVYVSPLGGLDAHTLLNQRFKLITSKGKRLWAVSGSKAIHLQEDGEDEKLKIKDMFLDFGVKNKEELQKLGVNIGEVLSYDAPFMVFGNGKYATGKALDNRTGCYTSMEIMRKVYKSKELKKRYTFFFAFTTQEEIGLKGARVAAFKEEVDFALVLDTSPAGDTPGIEKKVSELMLGKGVVIDYVQAEGRGLIMRKEHLEEIKKIFDKNKIPYQVEIGTGGVSDAAIIYITKSGIPTVGLGIAVRYLHTPVEVMHIEDLDNLVKGSLSLIESGFFNHFG